jgi:hypothetical protein
LPCYDTGNFNNILGGKRENRKTEEEKTRSTFSIDRVGFLE